MSDHTSFLSLLSTEGFSQSRGGRPEAARLLVVVTDGESHDGEELPAALKACEAGRVTRYGIAVRFCSGPGRMGWGWDGDIRTGNLRKTTSKTPATFPPFTLVGCVLYQL